MSAAILLGSVASHAADFRVAVDPKRTCSSIEVSGEIQPGDQLKFQVAAAEAAKLAPLRRLYLNSQGGEFLAATAIWQAIRSLDQPIQTVVNAGRQCSSACVLLLAAGQWLSVSASATMVVHQPRNVQTDKPSQIATLTFGFYLVESGFPREVVNTFVNLKSGQDLVITASNARRYGFGKIAFFGSSEPPAIKGCSWRGFLSRSP